MKRFGVAVCAVAALTLGVVGSASADEPAGESGEVVVVDFETFDVDDEFRSSFYRHIDGAIGDHPGLALGEIGAVTMDELLLMAGCDAVDEECLTFVGDLVNGDHLLFGSIERSDDVHMFTMSLFDFETGEFVNELTDQTLRGDQEWLAEGMPAVVEHLLYGETATVDVRISGGVDAEVQINGETKGTGSMTVDDIAPGEVVVVVTGPDGEQQQERLIVRHDDEQVVSFTFDSAIADVDDAPSLLPGVGVAAAGVAATVVGFVGQVQLTGADARAESLIDGRGAVDADQHGELQELEGELTRANSMRWVGFSAGTVGLIGGGFLLYQAMTHDAAGADGFAGQSDLQLDVGASDDGVSAGFRLSF